MIDDERAELEANIVRIGNELLSLFDSNKWLDREKSAPLLYELAKAFHPLQRYYALEAHKKPPNLINTTISTNVLDIWSRLLLCYLRILDDPKYNHPHDDWDLYETLHDFANQRISGLIVVLDKLIEAGEIARKHLSQSDEDTAD